MCVKMGTVGLIFLTNALCILSWTHAVRHSIFTYKFKQNLEWNLGCPNNYYTFVASTVGVNDIIFAEAKLQLKYYGILSQWHSPIYSSFNLYFILLQSTPCLP